jgi:hypothetical protein
MHEHARPLHRRLALLLAAFAGLVLAVCAALPAHASVPKTVAWESTAPFGTWHDGKFDVYNNEWNTGQAGPQTIWADSYRRWGVESTQASTVDVKTYPSVQENYNHPALRSLRRLSSSFRESMPKAANFDAEAAYDIWINNNNIEVMVWVDNHGQRPAGQVVARTTFYGKKYSLWRVNNTITFELSGKQETKGTVHLHTMLDWLISHGYVPSSATLTQVNFGWEICSTGGKPLDFTVSYYRLATRL